SRWRCGGVVVAAAALVGWQRLEKWPAAAGCSGGEAEGCRRTEVVRCRRKSGGWPTVGVTG
nr:hypothetical protein [Tanacetum cinerariifolium]